MLPTSKRITARSLLFDDALIDDKRGFRAVMNPAARGGSPVLVPDRPWEAGGLIGDSMVSVVDDRGLYRMWYGVPHPASLPDAGGERLDMPLHGLDAKTANDALATNTYVLCYAESHDGLKWEKPNLGILSFNGSKRNNMLFVGRLGGTVFLDPHAAPAARYKMIHGGGPRLPHSHGRASAPVRNIYHAIYGSYSPDGIRWTTWSKPILPWYTDTTNVAYWDDQRECYTAFCRWNEGMFYGDDRTYTRTKAGWKYRAVGQSHSRDFRSFPPPRKIEEPPPRLREPRETGTDYYNTSAVKYPWAPNSYFMFSSDFCHENELLDIRLATSRDGERYVRWPGPFLGLGRHGAFDSARVYMATGMIRHAADELSMYYLGRSDSHARPASGVRQRKLGGIGRVNVRLDGFVSQDAGDAGGVMTSVPILVAGRRLNVNCDASATGRLKVALCRPDGKPIPGFTEADARWLWGNDVAHAVTWNGNSDLSRLSQRRVRLRFIGSNLKLYSFGFSGGTEP